jgi:hypothetical protein
MTLRPQRLRGPAMRGVTRVVCIPPTDGVQMRLYLLSPLLGQLSLRVGPLDAHEVTASAVGFSQAVDLAVDGDGGVWVADVVGLHFWSADLDVGPTFARTGITAIAAVGADRIAVAYADGGIEMRGTDGAVLFYFNAPWIFVRLLWSGAAGLVGLTNDGGIVRFTADLVVVVSTTAMPVRWTSPIRDLRSAAIVGTALVMVGADRRGDGAVTTYDLATDISTSDRALAQSIILAAITAQTGTELAPDGVSYLPWHVPVIGLLHDTTGDSDIEAAASYDEVWIALDESDPLNATRHILNEIPQHITNEAGERIVWEGP